MPSPQFRLNTEGRAPEEIGPARADAITEALEKLLGTPDEPNVPEGVPLKIGQLRAAAGPVGSHSDGSDSDGSRTGLYRRHCVRCHGLSGDGAGPAAAMLNPYPRDFRRGIFKYTSTNAGAKPSRKDIKRTLLKGVPGTAMPSFVRLSQNDLDALVEYVKYLSIRGEAELYLLRLVVDEDEYLPLHELAAAALEEGLLPAAALWESARSAVVTPPPEPPTDAPQSPASSVAKGRELYAQKDAQCVKCHGPNGEGDGEDAELYDDWNKPKEGVTPEQTAKLARLFTLPIQQLRPRNFHQGTYRGGDEPVDLYWRIHVGIKGTPMPAAGPAPGAAGVLAPEEIWHMVHYLQSLSQAE